MHKLVHKQVSEKYSEIQDVYSFSKYEGCILFFGIFPDVAVYLPTALS